MPRRQALARPLTVLSTVMSASAQPRLAGRQPFRRGAPGDDQACADVRRGQAEPRRTTVRMRCRGWPAPAHAPSARAAAAGTSRHRLTHHGPRATRAGAPPTPLAGPVPAHD